MPRLSLYRPNRTADYQYIDRIVSEQFTVGGPDIHVHKYLGPVAGGDNSTDSGNNDATQPVYNAENPLFIEDLLLLENRDRVYDTSVYVMRGVYRTQDVDFDLTQFGLFLNNDTLFITFHYNDMIDSLGRKLMSGDVLELPNLKDYHPLDSSIAKAIPRYYVIQDAAYASEGFSQTWLPHLWRVKATPMVNAQEFNSITKQAFEPENIWDNGNFYPAGSIVTYNDVYYRALINVPAGTEITNTTYWVVKTPDTISEITSTRTKDLEINDAILTQAEAELPLSGYDTVKFYILPTYSDGEPASEGVTADGSLPTVDSLAGDEGVSPKANGYTLGYLTGDGLAPNGLPVTPGVSFPANPTIGDYALRLDYFPNRLFRYNGGSWIKIEDSVRTDLTPGLSNKTLRSSFVNNTATVQTNDRGNIESRQSLSEILKPRADNGG